MRFNKPGDTEWLNELVEHDVVRKGFDGLVTREGLDVLGHLLLNAERIAVEPWLQWLTSIRGLLRIASVVPNPEWIAGLPISAAQRVALANALVLPCFESAGAWVCATLRVPNEPARFQQQFGARMLFVAPTPLELTEAYKHYRQ